MLRSIPQLGWKPAIVCGLVCLPMELQGVPFSVSTRGLELKADSLVAAAGDTTLSLNSRAKLIKEATRIDLRGRSRFALAKLYMDEGSKYDQLIDAELWLRQAIARDPSNPLFKATYAELLWQLDDFQLCNLQAQEALELDPDNVLALYYAGRYAALQMERNFRTISIVHSKYVRAPFSLKALGEEKLQQAIGFLTRLLDVDPKNEAARLLLALVFYEAGQFDNIIDVFKQQLVERPEDADVNFVLGLGYHGKRDFRRAYQHYLEAYERLTTDERDFIQSAVLAGVVEDDPEGIDAYWTERDPLFFSPLNERLMEHCSRVAYANLRFSDPFQGVKGWETDKGEFYIRYGAPRTRHIKTGEISRRVEVWSYGDFSLWFENTILSAWAYGGAQIGRIAANTKEDLIHRVYERYPDPYAGTRYRPAHLIAQFRGEDGATRVELYYALPSWSVVTSSTGSGYGVVDLKKGMFLFDSAWDTVAYNVTAVNRLPRVTLKSLSRDYFLVSESLEVNPGLYHFILEAVNPAPATKRIGSVRDSLLIRRFDSDSLEISSVLLAWRVQRGADGPGRDGFRILPNPIRRFDDDTRGAAYFEVYNLTQNASGQTRYEVTYQLRSLTEKGSPVTGQWMTAVTYAHTGSKPDEYLYLDIDLEPVPPGLWDVRVVICDLQSETSAHAEESFRVMW